MMDIDKELFITCPEECGQFAVTCSFRRILENHSFLCEACGCEFQGASYPAWLNTASHCPLDPLDMQLFKDMQSLYAYLFAGGNCPSADFLEQLLLSYPQYWRLFPSESIPDAVVLKLMATDAVFVRDVDFSTLSEANWLEYLGINPAFADKCPWDRVSRYVVQSNQELPAALLQQKELIFEKSGLKMDKAFSSRASRQRCNLFNPIVFAKKMQWETHLNWKAFGVEELFSAFQLYPELLKDYPFTKENVIQFAWKRYDPSNWEKVINDIPPQSPLHDIYSLVSGKNVGIILQNNPQWERYCNWRRISADDWLLMLREFPQWKAHCPWRIFNSEQWLFLLKTDLDYGRHCPWGIFSYVEWHEIFNLVDTGDFKARQGSVARGWERALNYDTLSHPEYLAIFNLIHATGVAEALKRYPNFEKEYLDWNRVSGEEWLRCFAENEHYADRCNTYHWRKILGFINTLPENKRNSVRSFDERLWGRRLKILEAADRNAIVRLSAMDFYTLIDFMDWEWEPHFDWRALGKAEVLEVAKMHPEFLERYGFERIVNRDIMQLLEASEKFDVYCLEKAKGNDEFAQMIRAFVCHDSLAGLLVRHPERYPRLKPYFYLTLRERMDFSYFGVAQLRGKVAFYRLFVTQLVMFILGWFFLYFGECGYKAFRSEHPQEARTAMYVYMGFALVWSLIQAKLHEYCGKEVLSRFLGITQGMLGVMLFRYSFFLTNLTRLGYVATLFICGAYMLIMLISHHCSARKLNV